MSRCPSASSRGNSKVSTRVRFAANSAANAGLTTRKAAYPHPDAQAELQARHCLREDSPERSIGNYLAVIKVVGTGGGGSNAVNRMVEAGLRGCEFIAVNTDAQALLMVEADQKIHIGAVATRGLGAGADPQKGYEAAMESGRVEGGAQGRRHGVRHRGRRRRHGTGSAPVIAEIARELGALTVGVVTRPSASREDGAPSRPRRASGSCATTSTR